MRGQPDTFRHPEKLRPNLTFWQHFVNWLDAKRLAFILLGITAFVLVFGLLSELDVLRWIEPVDRLISDFYADIATDCLFSALTVLGIDALNARRHKEERKRAIIQQMGSEAHDAALGALRVIRIEGRHKDALEGAFLFRANLQGADLTYSNLAMCELGHSDLQGADLDHANLQRAFLHFANLKGASLLYANLQTVDLEYANLQGAALDFASLRGARLDGVEFNENTTLPDGSTWTSNTDMTRFTDPNHPDFWRSDDPESPAYRGNRDNPSDSS